MTKHTPGPWKAEVLETVGNSTSGFLHRWFVTSVDQPGPWTTTVARLPDHPNHIGEANARLIAAAPDLLEALEKISIYTGSYSAAIATEAIAKVRPADPVA